MLGSGASTPLEHVTWLAIKSPFIEMHENRSIDVSETSPDFTKTLDWQSETSSPSTSKIPKRVIRFQPEDSERCTSYPHRALSDIPLPHICKRGKFYDQIQDLLREDPRSYNQYLGLLEKTDTYHHLIYPIHPNRTPRLPTTSAQVIMSFQERDQRQSSTEQAPADRKLVSHSNISILHNALA